MSKVIPKVVPKGKPVKERKINFAADDDVVYIPGGIGEITVAELKTKVAITKVPKSTDFLRNTLKALAQEGIEAKDEQGNTLVFNGVVKAKRLREVLDEVAKAMGLKRKAMGIGKLIAEGYIQRLPIRGSALGLTPKAKDFIEVEGETEEPDLPVEKA